MWRKEWQNLVMDDELAAVPEESEQLDQLQADETLIDRGVDDVLDEGYVPPDRWSTAQGFGNTPSEMRQGENLDMRVKQEVKETPKEPGPWKVDPNERREVGGPRAGRLVDANKGYPDSDTEPTAIAHDVGLSGGAATAEEAAVHVITEEEPEDDDWRITK